MSVSPVERTVGRRSPGAPPAPFVRNEFLIGYEVQQEWRWLIACAFFFGGVGAGTYLVSYIAGSHTGVVVGLLVVALLKTTAHVLFLGRPLRAWRAVRRWRTSWISRGVIGITAFLLFGVLYASPFVGVSVFGEGSTAHDVVGVLAALSAVVVMVYDGMVMKTSPGIPVWDSWLMPVLALGYAALGGVTLTLVVRAITGPKAGASLEWLELALIAASLVLVAVYVVAIRSRDPAAQIAAGRLLHGELRPLFLIVGIGVGLCATLVLSALALATHSVALQAAGAVTDLLGHFVIFFALLRAGTYRPLRPVPAHGATTGRAPTRRPAAPVG